MVIRGLEPDKESVAVFVPRFDSETVQTTGPSRPPECWVTHISSLVQDSAEYSAFLALGELVCKKLKEEAGAEFVWLTSGMPVVLKLHPK